MHKCTKYRVLAICGSPSKSSKTRILLNTFAHILERGGAEMVFWDLAEEPLPIVKPEYHHCPEQHPDLVVREFVSLVQKCQAITLATPLYHGAFSGLLKNALDQLSSDALRDKPVTILSQGGSGQAASLPCQMLRLVVMNMHGICLPTWTAATVNAFLKSDDGQSLVDPELVNGRLSDQANELLNALVHNAPLLQAHIS